MTSIRDCGHCTMGYNTLEVTITQHLLTICKHTQSMHFLYELIKVPHAYSLILENNVLHKHVYLSVGYFVTYDKCISYYVTLPSSVNILHGCVLMTLLQRTDTCDIIYMCIYSCIH